MREKTKETKMPKKKLTTKEVRRCNECGKEAPNSDALSDCFECANVVDACEPCIQDHMAEQHPDGDEDE